MTDPSYEIRYTIWSPAKTATVIGVASPIHVGATDWTAVLQAVVQYRRSETPADRRPAGARVPRRDRQQRPTEAGAAAWRNRRERMDDLEAGR